MTALQLQQLFAPICGLAWLCGKIFLKRVVRRLAGREFDQIEAMAWFGVDLSVLALSLCVGLQLHASKGLNGQEATMLYIFLFTLVLFTACFYRGFLGVPLSKDSKFLTKLHAWSWMTGSVFLGSFAFVGIVMWAMQAVQLAAVK